MNWVWVEKLDEKVEMGDVEVDEVDMDEVEMDEVVEVEVDLVEADGRSWRLIGPVL